MTKASQLTEFKQTLANLDNGDPISNLELVLAIELVDDALDVIKCFGPDFNIVVYRLRHIQISLSTMKQSRQQMGRWKL